MAAFVREQTRLCFYPHWAGMCFARREPVLPVGKRAVWREWFVLRRFLRRKASPQADLYSQLLVWPECLTSVRYRACERSSTGIVRGSYEACPCNLVFIA